MRPRKFVRSTALMLVLTAALTVTAFAADPTQQPATKTDNKSSYYPTSVEMTEDDAGNPMIRKTYQLSVLDDPQKLPVADFERDGRRYYLLDMTKEDKIGVDTKEHSETVKLSSDTKEMEQILQRLDAQKEVTTEDGHTGVLTLDHTSVKVTADGYGTKKRTLSATRTYPNLSDADVALIPKTIQDNGHTLTLADVQWDSAYQTEADEAVVRYCATAQYTGESSSQYVTGYTVTADYSGRVTKTSCDTVVYTAIFDSMPLEGEQPVEETDHRLPIVLGGAALLGAMLGGAATQIKKKKKKGGRIVKMKLRSLIAAAALCTLCVGQASALEYTVDAPEDYLFGTPTSEGTVYEQESNNVDRGKNTALIPPGFGTATSYLPGSGEPLTPNLLPGAMSGGLISSVKTDSSEVNYPTVDSTADHWTGASFTAVTPNLYYNDDHLGTLSIPSIGLNVKVYQGTDSAALRKGAGHFSETSVWDGNVCLAGHNRGVANHFGKIHTLKTGTIITYTTKLGTRSYTVRSVSKVLYTDTSGTSASDENCLTLYTCVMDQPSYRWMVRAAAQ